MKVSTKLNKIEIVLSEHTQLKLLINEKYFRTVNTKRNETKTLLSEHTIVNRNSF